MAEVYADAGAFDPAAERGQRCMTLRFLWLRAGGRERQEKPAETLEQMEKERGSSQQMSRRGQREKGRNVDLTGPQ